MWKAEFCTQNCTQDGIGSFNTLLLFPTVINLVLFAKTLCLAIS